MNAAKNKSAEVLEFMKKDIEEFSTVVKSEATTIASSTAAAVKETLQLDKEDSTASTVKKSVSTFFGQVAEVFTPTLGEQFDEAILIQGGNPVSMTAFQVKLHQLMKEDTTYLSEVEEGETAQFEAWLEVSKETLDNVDRLTELLALNTLLQEKYSTLVPDKVSHSDFWKRYLFRRALLEDREAEEIRRRQREAKVADAVPWDKENLSEGIELSEEDQVRLLQEYEKEKSAEGTKTNSPVDMKMEEKNDLVIVGSAPSQTSSSKESTDEDWEKFDIDETEEKA